MSQVNFYCLPLAKIGATDHKVLFVLLASVKQTLKGTVAVSKLAMWLHHTGLPHGSCSYAIHKLNGFCFNNLGFKNMDLGVNDL